MKYYLFFIIICFLACKSESENNATVDKILKNKFFQLGDNDKTLFAFVKETDSILSQQDSKLYKGINNYVKGAYFMATSNFELSIKFLKDVEPNLKAYEVYDSMTAASYVSQSNVYTSMGNYKEGIATALKAKEIFEKLKSKEGIYGVNYSIARLYQSKGDIEKAKQILKENFNDNSKVWQYHSYHLLANIYGEKGEIDSALQIDNKIIERFANNVNSEKVSPFYNNKALCYNELKLFDSAEIYFKKSIYIDSIGGNLKNMAANYTDMGGMFLNKGDIYAAENCSIKALSLIKNKGIKPTELFCYKNLYNLNRKNKNYEKAFAYADTIKQVQKEIDNVALNRSIEELNLIYETTKKEKTIEAQKNTILKNNLLIFCALLLLSGVCLFVYNYYRKQKLKQALEKVIASQAQEKAISIAAEAERQRISKDLHDNMGAYTSALLANIEKLDRENLATNEIGKMKSNAENILASLRETIWVLNNKEIALNEFVDVFTNYVFKILKNYENINFTVQNNIENNKILPALIAIQLNKILQEGFQNAIKHSTCTKIDFTVNSHANVEISLVDNGIGFNVTNARLGNGLENMQWRAKEIDASLTISSAENKGTTIKIVKKWS
jgi:signal transduction histidine kinase